MDIHMAEPADDPFVFPELTYVQWEGFLCGLGTTSVALSSGFIWTYPAAKLRVFLATFVAWSKPRVQCPHLIHQFVSPMVIYGLASCTRLYYSFLQIHLQMLSDCENRCRETDDSDQSTPGFTRWDTWGARNKAPVWPIDVNKPVTLLLGTIVPLVLTLLELYF